MLHSFRLYFNFLRTFFILSTVVVRFLDDILTDCIETEWFYNDDYETNAT